MDLHTGVVDNLGLFPSGESDMEGLVGVVCVYEGWKNRVFDEHGELFKGEQNGVFFEYSSIE